MLVRILLCLGIAATLPGQASSRDAWVHLVGEQLQGWRKAHDWLQVGEVAVDADKPKRLVHSSGQGILLNGVKGRTHNLLSSAEFADVHAHIEFVVPEGSNSGVYFQGRYEIQIFDSFGKQGVGFGDCGGIYQRWQDGKGFEGRAPLVNASLAPGQWQVLDLVFRAPRFDASGKKIRNAQFTRVELNGVLIHQQVELSGPTRAASYDDEQPNGPLMLQGDHGPVAYRNIRLRRLDPRVWDAPRRTLPLVEAVEPQPLLAQAGRLVEALEKVGSRLPELAARRLRAIADEKPSAELVAELQAILDPFCLAMVEINPEARVKVMRGPAPAVLVEGGWRSFLVKVDNAAGLTGQLAPASPNALPFLHRSSNQPRPLAKNKLTPGQIAGRFLELAMFRQRPMQASLSGLRLEYAIVQIYSRDAGKREARLGFHAGRGTEDLGNRHAIAVLFDCRPSVRVELDVKDTDGAATTASFTISDGLERISTDPEKRPLAGGYRHELALHHPWDYARRADGRIYGDPFPGPRLRGIYPLPARRQVRAGYPDFFFQPQIYRSTGESVKLPPGRYDFVVTRGPEYLPIRRRVVVPEGQGAMRVTFQLERWAHLKKLGWYSVDHHVHAAGCSHYESPEQGVQPADMWRQVLGEDLNVGCVLTWGPCWYHQKKNFDGKTHPLSERDHLMRYDIEISGFPSSHAGHLCLLNLREDDYPGTKAIEQWPSWTLPVLQWAREQGGVVGYAHSGWGLQPERQTDAFPNYVMPKFDGIGANEYIVTVTHGAVDFISAGDTPLRWELNIWYHTLGAGYRTRISGETDFPCIFDERVGMARSYVKLDGELQFAAVAKGIAAGRSYVSDGKSHLLDFKVDACELGVGDSELGLDAAKTVTVRCKAACYLPVEQDALGAFIAGRSHDSPPYWDVERARIGKSRRVAVELVVNGIAVAKQLIDADGSFQDVSFQVAIQRSSWVALRVLYTSHTNPIFVLVDKQPIRLAKSAKWCLDCVERCWQTKSPQIRKSERAAAKAAYDRARAAYSR